MDMKTLLQAIICAPEVAGAPAARTLLQSCARRGRWLLGALAAVVLVGCGGGGGSSADAPTPAPVNHPVGGLVSGLAGTVQLQSQAGEVLSLTANGAFTFSTALAAGASYAVTVAAQPTAPSQTCTVTNGSGTVGSANVNNVAVSCNTNSFAVGGSVSGLLGTGLVLGINGTGNLAVSSNGAVAFGTALASGATYAVTVLTQPSAPSQTCTVSNGSGTVGSANVNAVAVTCVTNSFTIGGATTGLLGAGLVLRLNGATDVAAGSNGSFSFGTAIASGATYAVTVLTQPTAPSQTCTVSNASGTVGGTGISNIAVSCVTNSFTVGGTVSGLLGTGLALRINGAGNLAVSSNGAYTFSTPRSSGATYAVTVWTQPTAPSQTCTVSNASGTVGNAAVGNVTVSCSAPNPNAPTITSSAASASIGQSIRFDATATDPTGFALTYLWDFGDGASASSRAADHSYTTAGTYTVRLTAFNSVGGSATATLSQGVVSAVANALVPDCAGAGCAAIGPNTYGGSGTGVWRYSNLTASAVAIDLNISGVSPGKTVTLLFSNGSNASASSVPNPGVSPSVRPAPPAQPALPAPDALPAAAASAELRLQDRHDAAHARMLAANEALARSLNSQRRSAPLQANAAALPTLPQQAPALDTVRTWNDLYSGTSTPYSTAVRAVCAGPNGRNVVIWVDPHAMSSGKVTASNITAYADSVCGVNGSFSQLSALLGDFWGSGAASLPSLIGDTPLQDIHIAILDVPASAGWGGYFFSANNYKASLQRGSNEALVLFVNANFVSTSQNYTLSLLIHEATHMINFYQKTAARGTGHDTWLEETTAMMSEDIVTPTVARNTDGSGYNTATQVRLPTYVRSGGAVSYINWPVLSGPNYAIGGAFGAFINRRYGLSIYRQLARGCASIVSSYTCLDTLIMNNGGLGFADEFAHFGASVFGVLPAAGNPAGYGFPVKVEGGYSLAPVDVSALAAQRPATATPLGAAFTATTHTYQIDTIAAGRTSYVRNGVVVPANTTLLVLIQ
jgi:PKD repeat protein